MPLTFIDPQTGRKIDLDQPVSDLAASLGDRWNKGVVDVARQNVEQNTGEHYETQWGSEIGFQEFARRNPQAMAATPGRQLGWADFFDLIRARADSQPSTVYDAACGFGGVMDALFATPAPAHLTYVGADIHGALSSIRRPPEIDARIHLLRWDISDPLPIAEPFDFVICRASIHHTPAPRRTFSSLVKSLATGGRIAISAYARKARIREAVDDALRAEITKMPVVEAMDVAAEFTALGQSLRALREKVEIKQDLPWLGIRSGAYDVQTLIYDHIVKCFHNDDFGHKYSDVVNFDWYHPTFAYRYTMDELVEWFRNEGLEVIATASTAAQHFIAGRKP